MCFLNYFLIVYVTKYKIDINTLYSYLKIFIYTYAYIIYIHIHIHILYIYIYIYIYMAPFRIPLLVKILQNAKILHSKIALFWSYYEENLFPVKIKTYNQNYN